MSIEAMKMALEALEMFCEHGAILRPLETVETLRQAIEQAEKQEPLAWMHNLIEGNVITHRPVDIGRHPERWTPLYTAPPKKEWVGLTDKEITKLGNLDWDSAYVGIWYDFAKAIEAKLKEKNA